MIWKMLFPPRKKETKDEVRRLRALTAHAVVTNDRKVYELRQIMSGALRLREDYRK